MRNDVKRMIRLGCFAAVLLIAGCTSPSNSPPYPVDAGWRTEGLDVGVVDDTPKIVRSGSATHYQLQIQEVAGKKDPDGDAVYFRSSALPAYMSLDANTGLVTIDALPPVGVVGPVNFWSEDSNGANTSSTPYIVTFTISLT